MRRGVLVLGCGIIKDGPVVTRVASKVVGGGLEGALY
jgi:hypothetical protein